MNRVKAAGMALALGMFAMGAAWAAAPAADSAATAKEAEAMVKKGVARIKAEGREKAIAQIMDHDNKDFHDRDLYLVIHRNDGTCLAHGINNKMAGKNFLEMKDMDGKEYIKERLELARAKPAFWQDYKFTNPVTRKIEPKAMYCERLDDMVVCGGVYKK